MIEAITPSYGKPGIIASTSAARGSDQFTDMEEALADFLDTKTIVLDAMENVKVVDMASANPPFDPLVERMDRLISALWGAPDLSAISKSQGYGASVQQGETQILEEDDAELITDVAERISTAASSNTRSVPRCQSLPASPSSKRPVRDAAGYADRPIPHRRRHAQI